MGQFKRFAISLAAGASSLAMSHPARAQQAEQPPAADAPDTEARTGKAADDIVITARKREERLQDVPASVTALTADNLTSVGAVKFEDYIARVPSLAVDNTAAGGGLNRAPRHPATDELTSVVCKMSGCCLISLAVPPPAARCPSCLRGTSTIPRAAIWNDPCHFPFRSALSGADPSIPMSPDSNRAATWQSGC